MQKPVLGTEDLDLLAVNFLEQSDLLEDIDKARMTIMIELQCHQSNWHTGALLLFEEMIKKDDFVSEKSLCAAHRLIIEEQNYILGPEGNIPQYCLGQYRTENVPRGIDYKLVPTEMRKLYTAMYGTQCVHRSTVLELGVLPIDLIAEFHYEFEKIHPFQDGNGRVGRLTVWYLMRFFGLKPFVFESGVGRHAYFDAFRSPEAMKQYFREQHRKQGEK